MGVIEQFKKMIGQEAKNVSPSPYGRWLNGTLLEAEEGRLRMSYLIREEFANPAGIAHGGVLAGIIDEVMGMTTFSLGRDGFYVAANLNVDFLRPAMVGDEVTIQSEVIRAGKTIAHVECRISSKDGKLLAKATSNLIMTVIK
ncbi:PaaI family thioesterase [Arcticibacterium luteifluviistationis]|nr:PaaI family thioesterase [Arcticibacterium luteifluviistationis]